MMSESYTNASSSLRYEVTIDDKLKFFGEEISQGIRNISTQPKFEIDADIEKCREEAGAKPNPFIEYCILLYRRYAELAYQLKASRTLPAHRDDDEVVISFEPEDTTKIATTGGLLSLRHRVFWYRFGTTVLSFIAFIIMCNTPYIIYAQVTAKMLFKYTGDDRCPSYGSFNNRPYQLALVTALLVYLYNALLLIYYLLPIDDRQQKFIPGLKHLLLRCMPSEEVHIAMHRMSTFFTSVGLFLECGFDALFTAMSVFAAVLGAAYLNSVEQFGQLYFTIDSLFQSYSECLKNDAGHPLPLLRGALAMLFLSIIFQFIYTRMSMKRLHMDMISRSNDQGINSLPLPQDDISVNVTSSPAAHTSSTFSFMNRFSNHNSTSSPLASKEESPRGKGWDSDTIKL